MPKVVRGSAHNLRDWTPSHANINGWKERHVSAVRAPIHHGERGFVAMFTGWLWYADRHFTAHESGIGDDGVLGPEWAKIGAALRGLLNGSIGRLDAGTLDSILCDVLESEGFNPEDL